MQVFFGVGTLGAHSWPPLHAPGVVVAPVQSRVCVPHEAVGAVKPLFTNEHVAPGLVAAPLIQ